MGFHTVSRRVRFGSLTTGVVIFLAAVISPSGSAHATQFVVADATYTHSAQTTTDSHYRVNPSAGTPPNWTSPIDYANGSAHVRLEVKTKPNTTTQTCFQVCFEANQNYGCTDISKPYTTTGLYEWDTPFSRFFTPGPVSWDRGVLKVAILLKDTKNVKPAPENVGAATSALYMPTDVRVTVTIVSSGSTFQPPPGSPVVDAGPAPVDAGPAAVDAGAAEAGVGPRDSGASDAASEGGASPPPDSRDAADESGPTQPPLPPTGQGGSGGSAGSNPPAIGQDAAPPSTNPGSVGPDASPTGSGPPSAGQGTKGQPASGGSVASGCRVSGGELPGNLGGVACGVTLALLASFRRRRSSRGLS